MWIDAEIAKHCEKQTYLKVWVPEKRVVVLGSSNNPETEVHVSQCVDNGIEILKRAGGGGTVLLHEGCMIVGFSAWMKNPFENKKYFNLINRALIDCLAEKFPKFSQLDQAGLSDIVFADRKIAGTSLFRSRGYLLYQASILVEAKIDLMEEVLAHPSKEPSYRSKRSHRDFLTDLSTIEKSANLENLNEHFANHLETYLKKYLGEDLSEADLNHCNYLRERFRLHL